MAMADQFELLGQWLNAEVEKNEIYHNHKEVMAWTATTIWLTASGYLYIDPPGWLWRERLPFSFAYLCMTLLVLVFAHTQFEMRWRAADRTTALRMAMCELCRRAGNERRAVLPAQQFDMMEKEGFPRLVGKHLTEGNTVPRLERSSWGWMPWWGRTVDPRWKTEIPSYLAILIAALAVIYRVLSSDGWACMRRLVS